MTDLAKRIAELRQLEADERTLASDHLALARQYADRRAGIEEALAAFAAPEAPKPKRGRPKGSKTNYNGGSWEAQQKLAEQKLANTPSPEQSHALEAEAETSSG